MTERTDQLSRRRDSETETSGIDDSLLGDSADQPPAEPVDEDADGSRLGQYFAPRMFLLVFAVIAVLGQLGSTFVPLVGGPLGLFVGAFAIGLISGSRRYSEALVAGGLTGGLGTLVGNVTLAMVTGSTLTLAGVGVALGAALAVLGVYFGRDLRNGLTQEL